MSLPTALTMSLLMMLYHDKITPSNLPDLNTLKQSVKLPTEIEILIKIDPGKFDHVKISRMRRSVKNIVLDKQIKKAVNKQKS